MAAVMIEYEMQSGKLNKFPCIYIILQLDDE